MASMALVAGSVSTGGIAALAVRIVRAGKTGAKNNSDETERRNDDGDECGDNDGK
jgi:hypothetical protein